MKKSQLAIAVLVAISPFAHANEGQAQDVQQLDKIVISDRQGTKVQTNVVTLAEKNESTDTDLRSLLSKEASIEFGGGNGTSQFLTIRGMGQNSVDIQIDGASSDSQILYHQGRFIVDPSLLKSISVQKGAGSASAGIGATNGAIIVKTVDALDLLENSKRNYGFKLNTGYSSNDGYTYGASVFGKAGHFDGLFSFSRTDEDDYKAGKDYTNGLNGSNRVPYSALDKRSYIVKLGATFGDHRFVLGHLQDQHRGARLVREEFTTLNVPTSAPKDDPRRRIALDRQSPSYRETTLSKTNLEYTGKNLGFIQEVTADIYLMKNKRYSANDKGCGYCGNVDGPTTTVIKTKGINVNFDSSIGDNILVKYGVNYRHQEIEPHVRNPIVVLKDRKTQKVIGEVHIKNNPEKEDMAAYAEVISGIGDFTLTTGLRYDYFNFKANDGVKASGGKLNPSLGLIYQATPHLSFSANHNYASRSPRLYDALMVGTRPVSINPNIKAERARNTEIGFNYNNGNFTFEGSYFWQKVNDLIVNPQDRHAPADSARTEAINNGYSKNHGYELNLSYRYEGLTARFGVADSKPRFYLNNIKADSTLAPEFAVQAGRTWTAGLAYRFEQPSLEIGWKGRYVEDETGYALVGATKTIANTYRDSYITHDFYLNWKPLKDQNLNVNIALNNAFNKFYHPHSQRGETLAGKGRDFRLNVNYTF